MLKKFPFKTEFIIKAIMPSTISTNPFKYFKNNPIADAGECWPSDVVIKVSKGGSMTSELLAEWCTECYNKRHSAIFQPRSMLVLDQAPCHDASVIRANTKKCEVCIR